MDPMKARRSGIYQNQPPLTSDWKSWGRRAMARICEVLNNGYTKFPPHLEGVFSVDGFTIVIIKNKRGQKKHRVFLRIDRRRLIAVARVHQTKLFPWSIYDTRKYVPNILDIIRENGCFHANAKVTQVVIHPQNPRTKLVALEIITEHGTTWQSCQYAFQEDSSQRTVACWRDSVKVLQEDIVKSWEDAP